jgi:hypothetical protein
VAKEVLRLNPGEEIIRDDCPSAFWTALTYVGTLGLWAIWRSRHRFVLTNQRVVALKGVVTKSEKSVPLARIQDVRLSRSLLIGGQIRLSSAGGGLGVEVIGPLTRNVALQFSDAISTLIRSPHGDGVSSRVEGAASSGISEELQKLASLRDSGVLTEEEFAAQKAKLLS